MADEQDEAQDLAAENGPEDDLDALFTAHEAAGEADDAVAPGAEPMAAAPSTAPGASINVSPDLASLLGYAATDAISGLATRALDVLTVGIDSVAGQRAVLVDATVTVTDYASVEAEFAAVAHMGFEVKVSFPGESHLAAVLVPMAQLGELLSLDLSPESMEDAGYAQAQTESIGASMRQILDLASITLFGDELQGIEATLADLRIGQIEYTMGILSDVAQGAPPVRVHLVLARTNGGVVAVQLIIPSPLIMALAQRLDPSIAILEDEEAPAPFDEPTPIRRPVASAADGGGAGDRNDEPRGFGLSDDPGNILPLRPAGTFGASSGDDVDVHPVRFPTLGASSSMSGPRSLDLIMDVSMRVTVELGRSTMTVEDVLALGPGSVIELNKLAGEPVDILVNDQLIARGEVVVVDENFGVRVTEIVSPRRRASAMGN